MQFLNLVSISQLNEFILSEKDLFLDSKSMPNKRSTDDVGLTKEFHDVFWEDPKTRPTLSFKSVFEVSNSKKQFVTTQPAVICSNSKIETLEQGVKYIQS